MSDRWFPGPLSHPFPTVSNCRTDQTFDGNPQAAGRRAARLHRSAGDEPRATTIGARTPGVTTDDLEARRRARARELRRARLRRARGGPRRPPAGDPARRHPADDLLVRAVGRPGRNIKTRTDAAQGNSTSATTGARGARRPAWRVELSRSARHVERLPDRRPRVPPDAGAGAERRGRLERPGVRCRGPSPSPPTRRRSRATTRTPSCRPSTATR